MAKIQAKKHPNIDAFVDKEGRLFQQMSTDSKNSTVLNTISATYIQEADCESPNDFPNELSITNEFGYLVIKTDRWAIDSDNIEEFIAVLKDFESRYTNAYYDDIEEIPEGVPIPIEKAIRDPRMYAIDPPKEELDDSPKEEVPVKEDIPSKNTAEKELDDSPKEETPVIEKEFIFEKPGTIEHINRDGACIYFEPVGENEYVIKSDIDYVLKYMRCGIGDDPDNRVYNFIDPSGGPFLQVGSKIPNTNFTITDIKHINNEFHLFVK